MTQRTSLGLAWLLVLGVLGWYAQQALVIGTDLRLFLPNPQTPEQSLLLNEIGEGPSSRTLVLAIDGAEPEVLTDVSRAMVAALDGNPQFRLVANGEVFPEALAEEFLPYRYLLSPTLDTQALDAAYLREQLDMRARDLASPAGAMLETLLPRDPTLELMQLLESWQPAQDTNRLYDVWFDTAGERALLIAETLAPAFDPDRQRAALAELQRAFDDNSSSPELNLTISGPGAFSMLMEQRTRSEAQLLGAVATVGMLILLFVAYRSVASVICSILPLATAAIAGLLAVSLLFDAVHGITLAFGFTLIGVAQDYPLHLLSHTRPHHTPAQVARALWPTLATGIASTCIAYMTFLFSGVAGLQQLGCFTIAALAAAGLSTRYLLPRLIGVADHDFGASQWLGNLWQQITVLPRPRWAIAALVLVCAAALTLVPGPLWENDLSKLTPVPDNLLQRDQELRAQLGSPDLRYLFVLEASSDDEALAALEALGPGLDALKREGLISAYDHAAHYLPSRARQLERQQKLPDTAALRAAMDVAVADTAFRADVFEPFIEDVAAARELMPLTAAELRDSPVGASIELLLTSSAGKSTAFVTFAGVRDAQALGTLAQTTDGAILLDLKQASETLVAEQRTRLLWSLAVAAVLLVGVVAIALRRPERVLRVLAPMALTTLIVLAILHGFGVPLTLFHLIALILAAGLGLDYALFFEHAADDAQEQRRTLHAVLVCTVSTLMVFALLGSSSLPVLRAIGLTVALGVVSNFVLALLLTRERRPG